LIIDGILEKADPSVVERLRQTSEVRIRNLRNALELRRITIDEVVRHAIKSVPLGELLICGSVVEGLSNPYSDIDIFVIGEDVEHDLVITGLSEIRIDLEVWPIELACALATRINDAGGYLSDLPYFGTRDLKFVARLYNALRLPEIAKPFSPEALGFRRQSVAVLLARRHMASADSLYQDAAGALEIHDYLFAFTRARDAFTHALDALLSCYGWLEPDKKHRLTLMKQLPAAGSVRDRYIQAQASWCGDEYSDAWANMIFSLLSDLRKLIARISRWLDANSGVLIA
jgi:predicted nucleotidyltransferase